MKKWLLLAMSPWALFYLGAALNCIAMTANNGLMPVLLPSYILVGPATVLDPRHISWSTDVQYKLLCDWIAWFGESTCSIGDLFIWLGDCLKVPAVSAAIALIYYTSE